MLLLEQVMGGTFHVYYVPEDRDLTGHWSNHQTGNSPWEPEDVSWYGLCSHPSLAEGIDGVEYTDDEWADLMEKRKANYRASSKKFRTTSAGKAYISNYRKTPAFKAWANHWQRTSPLAKARKKRYYSTEKGKKFRARDGKKVRATQSAGKALLADIAAGKGAEDKIDESQLKAIRWRKSQIETNRKSNTKTAQGRKIRNEIINRARAMADLDDEELKLYTRANRAVESQKASTKLSKRAEDAK